MSIFFGVILGLVVGVVSLAVGIVVLFLIAPFFKGVLMNDPDNPKKFALFTEVEPGRAKLKMRGGRVVGVVRGGDKGPKREDAENTLWWFYQRYVFSLTGLYVIGIPLIQTIYSYKLPRYRVVEVDGKKEFSVVPENDGGFYTDHVRNELTTWYFQFSGAEVDTVPVTVKGSVQIRIREGREKDALFKTDSWNVLLDQALNGVIRSIMRARVSIDQIIGSVPQDLWKDPERDQDTYELVREALWKGLQSYTIKTAEGDKTLTELIGLSIERVDIIDFAPDLEGAELAKLSAPALVRQVSRARVLEGKGEAEYQEQVLSTTSKYQDTGLAHETIRAEAFVKAAGKGSLDALAAGLLKKLLQ